MKNREAKISQSGANFQASYQQLMDIIEFLPQATFVIDRDRRVIAWNRGMQELTGVAKEDIIGKNDYAHGEASYGKKLPMLVELLFKNDKQIEQQYEYIERTSNNTISSAEIFVPTANEGKGAYYWAKASLLYDSSGNVVGAIESIEDITARKRMEKELKTYRIKLEAMVRERTNQLLLANKRLEKEIVKRNEVEKSLRSSEQEKELILDNLLEHVIYYDTNMNIKWANRSACIATSLDHNLIKGKRCYEIITQRDTSCPGCPVVKTLETGLPHENEVATVDDKVWRVRAYPVRDDDKVVGVVELAVDITRQNRAEQALKESEEKFRSFVENAGEIIYSLNASEVVTYVSPNLKDMLGHDVSECLNKNATFFMHPDDIKKWDYFLNKLKELCIKKGNIEYRMKHKGGSWRWYRSSISVLKDSSGIISFLGIARDITGRKKVHDSLKRFRAAIDNTTDSIFLINYETMLFEDVNEAACKSLGYSRKELLTMGPRDIVEEDINKAFIDIIEKRQSMVIETVHRRKNGESFPVELLLNFVKVDDSMVIVASARDITQRKQYEKEMARLEVLSLVGKMAAGIGHEIRNPMTTVRGVLQIHAGKEELAQYKQHYDLMINELDRANSIITEYLSLAKDKALDKKMQNLSSIVVSLYSLIYSKCMEHQKHIRLELQQVPDLLLDKQEMHQLILNLVSNGLDAMPEGGTLTIRTFMNGQDVVLSVEDQGHGIEPHVLEKMGTPFFTTKEYGTGLGLSVCYSIAARHNAVIDVETSSAGTTFFVCFKGEDFTAEAPGRGGKI